MFIFIEKGEKFNSLANYFEKSYWICEKPVQTHLGGNHIEVIDDPDIVLKLEELKDIFIKATIIDYPKYDRLANQPLLSRSYGKYQLGKAEAELIPKGDTRYILYLSTNSWEGIRDMKNLQERLWAGTLAPYVFYGREQKKQNIFQVLMEILNLHKLSPVKRFFLALRLTKVS